MQFIVRNAENHKSLENYCSTCNTDLETEILQYKQAELLIKFKDRRTYEEKAKDILREEKKSKRRRVILSQIDSCI